VSTTVGCVWSDVCVRLARADASRGDGRGCAELGHFRSSLQLRTGHGSCGVMRRLRPRPRGGNILIYATVFAASRVCCRTTRALAYAVGLGSRTGRAARLGHSLIAFSAPFLEV
jgi:hypothetical protein